MLWTGAPLPNSRLPPYPDPRLAAGVEPSPAPPCPFPLCLVRAPLTGARGQLAGFGSPAKGFEILPQL